MVAIAKKIALLASLFLEQSVVALTPAEWRSQSIYFLLTDRFGREDNSTTASCDVSERVCLKTLRGISNFYTDDDDGRSIAVAVGKELSTMYVIFNNTVNSPILKHVARLYSRDGIHCHLDHASDGTTPPRYWRRWSVPRILATGDVSKWRVRTYPALLMWTDTISTQIMALLPIFWPSQRLCMIEECILW